MSVLRVIYALQQAGWTPTWTLTEDFALGMEMKRYGWHCRYLNKYLAVGEAPDGVRNCFQQRSRWTKVHRLPGCLRITGIGCITVLPL